MKKSYLIMAAIASLALVSCSDEEFVGNPELGPGQGTGAIAFASFGKGMTRADVTGADAAALLGNKFVVTGVKGDGTWNANQTDVFKSYSVEWTQNTAGTTESNTSDWEYVGVTPVTSVTGVNIQTIKYWDYSNDAYNFAAYSLGKGATTTGDNPTTSYARGTAITIDVEATANAGAYTLTGNRAELSTCYITDMITVAKSNYQKEVQLKFRSLATKVRMALYETVPGYSVKDVKFYSTDQTSTINSENYATATDATLFGTGAFREAGEFKVKFPTIGSDNSSDKDHNKAHVTFTAASSGATSSAQGFGNLNYGGAAERYEASGNYLQRSSINPSFAGSGTYYQVMLPNEEGAVLEMCVDYTLVSIDGSGEEIKVHGAKAFVPAVYTKWLPNYAYTYIFKISDNTNGWTNPNGTDPAGLFPITFDAVVLNDETSGTQTTITTVATPSITTYQRGHVYSASNEYPVPNKPDETDATKNDAIYAQVMQNGTLVTDLSTTNSFFYKITGNPGTAYSAQPGDWPTGYYTDADCTTPASSFTANTTYYKSCTEADVMDALNIRTSGEETTVVGRNGITLTPATAVYNVTQIPGEDGNWITKYGSENTTIASGMVAKLSPAAVGTYAFVYYTGTDEADTEINTAVKLTGDTAPTGWPTGYYTDEACTTTAPSTYAAGTYYQKYTDLNKVYGVKVIKVVSGS